MLSARLKEIMTQNSRVRDLEALLAKFTSQGYDYSSSASNDKNELAKQDNERHLIRENEIVSNSPRVMM